MYLNKFLIVCIPLLFYSCSEKEDLFEPQIILNEVDSVIISWDSRISDVGDSVVIGTGPEIEKEKMFSFKSKTNSTIQGFSIYDDHLFQCHHSNDVIDVIDLKIKDIIASIDLVKEEVVHGNNVNFGPFFYATDDKYPVLYIQQRGFANKLNAYRINTDSDSIFSAEKVQVLSFLSCETSVTAIDRERSLLYVIFSYKGSKYIATLDMPSPSANSVNLDILKAIDITYLPEKKIIQDSACYGNFLYFLSGYGGEGELWRINMLTKEAIVLDLTEFGLKGEPEGIDYYDGGLVVSFLNGVVYRIFVNNESGTRDS